jgi:hypothetical protein
MVTNNEQQKVAVFVFADTISEEGLGRVVNAMMTVKEFRQAGQEARLYFDGTGTRWPQELDKPDHKAHALYSSIKNGAGGACLFCASVFGAKEAVKRSKVELLNEFEQHISVRNLLSEGYAVLNF